MEHVTLGMIAFVCAGIFLFVIISMLVEDNFLRARAIIGYFVMSRTRAGDSSHNGAEVVHVPVAPTSTQVGTGTAGDSPGNGTLADTSAVPRISRYLSDDEFIVLLAVLRLPGGKYRLSANQIVAAAGGKRADVLALVRAVRDGPAAYPERTPEQLATRQQLELDKP